MSEDLPQTKYVVEVTVPEKSPPTPKQYVQDLKGVAGGKQLARMKTVSYTHLTLPTICSV